MSLILGLVGMLLGALAALDGVQLGALAALDFVQLGALAALDGVLLEGVVAEAVATRMFRVAFKVLWDGLVEWPIQCKVWQRRSRGARGVHEDSCAATRVAVLLWALPL